MVFLDDKIYHRLIPFGPLDKMQTARVILSTTKTTTQIRLVHGELPFAL